ncbi:hypothetical protein [Paenibacillus camerounensis]|uniref:hypothetical protein n=1 Tax=Paenibacillus camerounensis TaxID=1243663 RepID=UPI0005AB49FF|nr:hypothetical protein [Paenibacillus camerounensis]
MTAKHKNTDFCMLAVSAAVILYFIFAVIPYGDSHNFFSEASVPEGKEVWPYFLMTTPALIVYLIIVFKWVKRIRFLRWLNYPVIIFVVNFISLICLSAFNGGTVFWLIFITGPVSLILTAVFFTIGLIKDLRFLRAAKEQQ